MSKPDFEHIRLSTVGDVVLIELITKDIQGPKLAQELGTELAQVLAQDWAKRLLLDFHKVAYFSSTGFAVLFRLVTEAKQERDRAQVLQHGRRRSSSGPTSSASTKWSRSTRPRQSALKASRRPESLDSQP